MELLLSTLRRPNLSWTDKVAYLGYAIRQKEGSVNEQPVRHLFEKGRYIREVMLPADVVFIGRGHKVGHTIELAYGSVELFTEYGASVHKAPDAMESVPGFQMVLHTLTPVLGRTIHPNPDELRDINVLELQIFEPEEAITERGKRVADQLDYAAMIESHGITEEQIQAQMSMAYASGFADEGQDKIIVGISKLNGKGCFAKVAIEEGEFIALGAVLNRGTLAGRYTNHSLTPNALASKDEKGAYMTALKPIAAGEEITMDYRQVFGAVR